MCDISRLCHSFYPLFYTYNIKYRGYNFKCLKDKRPRPFVAAHCDWERRATRLPCYSPETQLQLLCSRNKRKYFEYSYIQNAQWWEVKRLLYKQNFVRYIVSRSKKKVAFIRDLKFLQCLFLIKSKVIWDVPYYRFVIIC